MPYKNTRELPDSVKHNLPMQAQEVYKEAFNSAFEQYKNPADRYEGSSLEETAHRVAWSAVKKAGYKKQGDSWKRILH